MFNYNDYVRRLERKTKTKRFSCGPGRANTLPGSGTAISPWYQVSKSQELVPKGKVLNLDKMFIDQNLLSVRQFVISSPHVLSLYAYEPSVSFLFLSACVAADVVLLLP